MTSSYHQDIFLEYLSAFKMPGNAEVLKYKILLNLQNNKVDPVAILHSQTRKPRLGNIKLYNVTLLKVSN